MVAFPPLTSEGGIHNLKYGDCSFDFIFTNIFDHSLYPSKFVSEMERICDNSGYILVNLQVHNRGDDYSENVINDLNGVIKLFKESQLVLSRRITNTFDGMDWEIIMQKR